MTIAMITHEVPGDTFWDLIRKGAEAAAKKDNIELRYSNDPGGAEPGQPGPEPRSTARSTALPSPWPSPRRWHAAVKAAEAEGHPGGRLQLRSRQDWQAMGVQEYFGQDEMHRRPGGG